jgi:hypothetical protein
MLSRQKNLLIFHLPLSSAHSLRQVIFAASSQLML